MEQKFETVVSGSFKFKPEIDRLHEEFRDYNVTVLEPEVGWLYVPSQQPIIKPSEFRPLPSERNMQSIFEVEKRFLDALEHSDFLYVFNPSQYLGVSTAFEIGYATGLKKPVFAKEALSLQNADYDLGVYDYLLEKITVATPAETVKIMKDLLEQKLN